MKTTKEIINGLKGYMGEIILLETLENEFELDLRECWNTQFIDSGTENGIINFVVPNHSNLSIRYKILDRHKMEVLLIGYEIV
jgi:hypothetical protein